MKAASAVNDTSGFSSAVVFVCVCSCGHHQGPVPECEVQPPQGVRRSGLPEGHVCQPQETGAQVRWRFGRDGSEGRVVLCVQETSMQFSRSLQTLLRRWCEHLLDVCQLKGFEHMGGELLIKLSNKARECHESGGVT